MFERLIQRLRGAPHETELPPEDARHAMGALLVQVARADNAYLFEEIEQIDRILAAREKCSPLEAAKMRARCERLEEAMPGTEDLAQVLHRHIPGEAREAAVRALWSVVFSDGVEEAAQDDLLHRIEAILGVPPARARTLHDEEMAKAGRPIVHGG